MTGPSFEEKRAQRIEKYLAPLIERRDFLLTFGIAAGTAPYQAQKKGEGQGKNVVGTSKQGGISPAIIVQGIANSDQALAVAYYVFFEAADEKVESHDPTDVFSGVNNGYYTGNPDAGPNEGRTWLIWRLRATFRKKWGGMPNSPDPGTDASSWKDEAHYVLLKAARMGMLARRQANGTVKKSHILKALASVRPTAAEATALGDRFKIFNQWCDF